MNNQYLFLIHWHPAEAEEYALALRSQGWRVEFEAQDGARAAKAIKADPPQAVLIYLTRRPSHGRATAAHLAEAIATQDIPLIFIDGEGEALEKTKAALPHASFIAAEELDASLNEVAGTR